MIKDYTNITAKQTNDPLIKQQYYDLRDKVYRESLKLDLNINQPDEFDKISDCFVVMDGNKVVGGARVTISTPENRILLPLETQVGQRIFSLKPDLNLEDKIYCEISRLAIADGYRHKLAVQRLTVKIFETVADINCNYSFSLSTLLEYRAFNRASINYLNTSNKLYKHALYNEVEIPFLPDYKHLNNIGIYLCATEL
ncbi:MAG: GNAT family N-acetyltransferase [Rickettsiales bacterium]|nr:GNAT family N-acetyltransferase [Rickettsiales bacterium]